jgi:hypothetical protein
MAALESKALGRPLQCDPNGGALERRAEPDELVLQGAEAKRLARWRVIAIEEGRTPGGSKAMRTAVWSYMLDEDGSIPLVGGWPWFGSWDRDVESERLALDRLKYLHPMLLAISAWNENAAVYCDRLVPPYFQLKLRPGCLPTIGRHPQRATWRADGGPTLTPPIPQGRVKALAELREAVSSGRAGAPLSSTH